MVPSAAAHGGDPRPPTDATATDATVAAAERTLGVVPDAAILADAAGRIVWVGPAGAEPAGLPPWEETVDLGGAVVLPGLVDAHTHTVFAGDRARDFALRASGVPYEEVARRGGGIRLTVRATRAASVDELVELARPRLAAFAGHGVTTVEIKSGYGLTTADELKMLEAAARLADEGPCRVVPTVLAAHIVPDELSHDRAAYVRLITGEILPEAASRGLARQVDAFCDVGAFTLDETLTVLACGLELGLAVKVHAEQLTWTGASGAAAQLGAVSADHLEHVTDSDISAMSAHGTVAVLLPGAAICLGGASKPPARRLADAGVAVALSTDCNPGSSPTLHLPLMASLGCTWLGLRPEEALAGVTRHAARALGLDDGTGTLARGAPCDLAVCDVPSWVHVVYGLGHLPVRETWVGGVCVARRPSTAGAWSGIG